MFFDTTPQHEPPEATAEDEARKAAEEAEAESTELAEDGVTADSDVPAHDPLRPLMEATNPKVAGPPSRADQPGLGRAANPPPAPGISPDHSVGRVGREIERRQETAAEHRAAMAAAQD